MWRQKKQQNHPPSEKNLVCDHIPWYECTDIFCEERSSQKKLEFSSNFAVTHWQYISSISLAEKWLKNDFFFWCNEYKFHIPRIFCIYSLGMSTFKKDPNFWRKFLFQKWLFQTAISAFQNITSCQNQLFIFFLRNNRTQQQFSSLKVTMFLGLGSFGSETFFCRSRFFF